MRLSINRPKLYGVLMDIAGCFLVVLSTYGAKGMSVPDALRLAALLLAGFLLFCAVQFFRLALANRRLNRPSRVRPEAPARALVDPRVGEIPDSAS